MGATSTMKPGGRTLDARQKRQLLKQIAAMYEAWACDGLGSESFSRLLNGLFNIARDIDDETMAAAFKRGAESAYKKTRC